MSLAVVKIDLTDLDGFLNLENVAGPNLDSDQSSLGVKYRMETTLTFTPEGAPASSLDGATIYYDPALWVDRGTQNPFAPGPPTNTYKRVLPSPAAVGVYTMAIPSTTPLQSFNNKRKINQTVEVEILSATDLVIRHDFYMTSDAELYTSGGGANFSSRLKKNAQSNGIELSNATASVYSVQKSLSQYIYVGYTTTDVTANVDSLELENTFKSRFYDRGLLDAPAVLFNFGILSETAGENPCLPNILSAYNDNTLTFTIDKGAYVGDIEGTKVFFFDQTVNFGASDWYDSQIQGEAVLVTDAGTTQLDGVLHAPSQIPVASGTVYTSFVTIPAGQLEYGKVYNCMVVYYMRDGDNTFSESFYSPEVFNTTCDPDPCELDMTGEIDDYTETFGDNVSVAPEERLVIRTIADASVIPSTGTETWLDCAEALGNPRSLIEYITRIEVKTYDINDPSTVFSTSEAIKNIDNTFTASNALAWVVDSLTDPNRIESLFYLRALYENFSGAPDWIGQDIGVDVSFFVTLTSPNTFETEYVKQYQVSVNGYENNSGTPVVTDIQLIDNSTGLIATEICSEDCVSITGKVILDNGVVDSKLLALIDKYNLGALPGNDLNLGEEESFLGGTSLPQSSTEALFDVSEDFTASTGNDESTYKIDCSELEENRQYRTSAIVKRSLSEEYTVEINTSFIGGVTGQWNWDLVLEETIGGASLPAGTKVLFTLQDADDSLNTVGTAQWEIGDTITVDPPDFSTGIFTDMIPHMASVVLADGVTMNVSKLDWADTEDFLVDPFVDDAKNLVVTIYAFNGPIVSNIDDDPMGLNDSGGALFDSVVGARTLTSNQAFVADFNNGRFRAFDYANGTTRTMAVLPFARQVYFDTNELVDLKPVMYVWQQLAPFVVNSLRRYEFNSLTNIYDSVGVVHTFTSRGSEVAHIDPNQTFSGRSAVWVGCRPGTGPGIGDPAKYQQTLALLEFDGVNYIEHDFYLPLQALYNPLSPGNISYEIQSICVDSSGRVYCGVRGLNNIAYSIIRLTQTGPSYNNPADWTAKIMAGSATANGDVDGLGGIARFSISRGMRVVGYDGIFGLTSGTEPMILLSDIANRKYKILTHDLGSDTFLSTTKYGSGAAGSADGVGVLATFDRQEALTLIDGNTVLSTERVNNNLLRTMDLTTDQVTTVSGTVASGYNEKRIY